MVMGVRGYEVRSRSLIYEKEAMVLQGAAGARIWIREIEGMQTDEILFGELLGLLKHLTGAGLANNKLGTLGGFLVQRHVVL
jgi:DnaJ-class molecular chaperone